MTLIRSNRWKRTVRTSGLFLVLILVTVVMVYAWGATGHRIINLKAVMHLPSAMSALKADSIFLETHASDADNRKVSGDTSFYAESPRHFLDIDAYPNYLSMPRDLNTLISLYGWQTVKQSGTLPWTTVWYVDSLGQQLARGDSATALQTMADLGHYVADAHQPLHCTENYDGQFTGNNGVHSRYETTMINAYQALLTVHPDSIHYVSDVLDFVFDYIYVSNSYVDSILAGDTYAKVTSGWNGSGSIPSAYTAALWSKTGVLTQQIFQKATVDLACLWYTSWVNSQSIAGVGNHPGWTLPRAMRLEQNYPNPFNPATTIRFSLDQSATVTLRVYDSRGEELATLMNGRLPAGSHEVVWDGSRCASGVYFVRLSAGVFSQTEKVVLLK
ncbi:MAG TPA: T9SS type A sorting domain-containing protein [Bacteroidota bacterium]|nr:T9SS type A sorting domain-containing protein [Bacteroidota bacterium]